MRDVLLGLCILLCSIASAQVKTSQTLQSVPPETAGMSNERLKRIDTSLQGWVDYGRMNGAVALIARNGKIVYHKAFGFDDEEKKISIQPDAIYRIVSLTKQITSVAVMMLYEEGKVLLDDPISRYIPEFAKPQVLDKFNVADSSFTTVPAKSEITVRQLLTHTSGLGYALIGSPEARAVYAKAGITAGIGTESGHFLATDMKKLAKLPLMQQPGEKYIYGLNSEVLGYLVEVLSGMSLDDFFRKKIFEPLGMKDTYFHVPAAKQKRLVSLFQEVDGKLVKAPSAITHNNIVFRLDYPQRGSTYLSGGTGLSSTIVDYAVFLQMLLNGGEYNGKRLLSRNTVRMMTMNQIGDIDFGNYKFGLGFQLTTEKSSSISPSQQGMFEGGGGTNMGFQVDPKENLICIIFRQIWGSIPGDTAGKIKVLMYSAIND